MARNPEDSFNPYKNTASRRQLIDYDYLDQLSPEDYEWLAKVNDEYYCADFEINPTFCTKEDALKVCLAELSKLPVDSRKFTQWSEKLAHYQQQTTEYVQISQNSPKKHNIDLRKCRSITLFRKTTQGKLSENPKFKYNSIHDPKKYLKDCNERSSESAEDIFSVQRVIKQEANEYCVDNQVAGGYTPEEWLILEENEEIMDDWGDEE